MNPYQDIIDWLESPQGIIWSRENFKGTYSGYLFNWRDDIAECSRCVSGTEHTGNYLAGAKAEGEGPWQEHANAWVRAGYPGLRDASLAAYANGGEYAYETSFNPVQRVDTEPFRFIAARLSPTGSMTGRLNRGEPNIQ